MDSFPHRYAVTATGGGDLVHLESEGLERIEAAAPASFDGPGDKWSPETLFTASIGTCFILTFKAVAAASKLDWRDVECAVETTLDRVDRTTKFTDGLLNIRLTIADEADRDQAQRVLEKSKQNCLVSNSLNFDVRLESSIETGTGEASAAGI